MNSIVARCKKKYFATRSEAKSKKRSYEKQYGKKFSIYKCLICDWWHYTSHTTIEQKQKCRVTRKKLINKYN